MSFSSASVHESLFRKESNLKKIDAGVLGYTLLSIYNYVIIFAYVIIIYTG